MIALHIKWTNLHETLNYKSLKFKQELVHFFVLINSNQY
nr:MAG TPA: hypothetical protein [Microviridae sp.]